MATTLIIRGGQVELAENFNKVFHRIEKAKKRRKDYLSGATEDFVKGEDRMLFYTDLTDYDEDDEEEQEQVVGRIFLDVDDVFGVMSDQRKDINPVGEDVD